MSESVGECGGLWAGTPALQPVEGRLRVLRLQNERCEGVAGSVLAEKQKGGVVDGEQVVSLG